MMNQQTFKIYNEEDFKKITNGIKVAQCMRFKPSISEIENPIRLDELIISDSLSCNFCNTVFEDRDQQRLHYKLDWHRYNLKRRLHELKSISEEVFDLIADKDDVSSISGSESDADEEDSSDVKESPSRNNKNGEQNNKNSSKSPKKGKVIESDSANEECNEEYTEEKKSNALKATASRHTKVFFENEDGNIFSIYRCLLHNKKDVPEKNEEIIAQALDSGQQKKWTVIMIGGGHFAAAVFLGGEAIVHKTFHSYTVRAKQGSSQGSHDNRSGNHPKSAGASLRRYNEKSLFLHVQDILSSWSSHINESSLILYRAVRPQNRSMLFGGKNPPLDKSDFRLRPLPFPTRRATFKELKRVYDVVSSIEIYGPAVNFTDSFPVSPRQPVRKKSSKPATFNETDGKTALNNETNVVTTFKDPTEYIEEFSTSYSPEEKTSDNTESDSTQVKYKENFENELKDLSDYELILDDVEISFEDELQLFHDTVPKHFKNKKNKKNKKKGKKEKTEDDRVKNFLIAYKSKLWRACKIGDVDLFDETLQDLLSEVEQFEKIQSSTDNQENSTTISVNKEDVIKLMNESNEEGNTMLHIAAAGDHIKVIWSLLTIGSSPCNKNKKLQTPYTITTDKKTRNTFRRFMGEYPDKFNYNKSQIPGPLNNEIEYEEMEKKKLQRKMKREKDKIKKKELEIKKREEAERQQFLRLSDREKRAVAAERRMEQNIKILRCFQCGNDVREQSTFEYNENKFCSMPCLKEHRTSTK